MATTCGPSVVRRRAPPIDTSQWRTDGTCSFKWGQYGVDTGPYLFTGTREIAFIAGTEIPYLVFGCSGSFEGTTLTFLGGTFTDPSDGGLSNPQWALLDRVVANPPPEWDGHDSYWLDDTQISKCNLTESSASFGTIGSAVSGTFACEEMAGTGHDLSAVVDGTFGTVLSARVPFDLP